jgi:hypothetical protein
MSANTIRKSPTHVRTGHLARAQTTEELLQPRSESATSPALQLQNMLIESFSPIEASVRKADKYDVRIRIACIVGISAAGWGIIALAIKGLLAAIAAF